VIMALPQLGPVAVHCVHLLSIPRLALSAGSKVDAVVISALLLLSWSCSHSQVLDGCFNVMECFIFAGSKVDDALIMALLLSNWFCTH